MSTTLDSKPKLQPYLMLLLVIALGISLAKLMWLVLTPEKKLVLAPTNNNIASIAEKEKTNYGKLIADQHIFGKVVIEKAPKKSATKPKEVVKKPVKPKIKVNANLHGIVAYQSKQGFALISNNSGPQKVYAKGDTLQEGVTVSDILPTKVLLNNNGVEEELLLPVKSFKDPSKARRTSQSKSASLPGANPPTGLPNGANNTTGNTAGALPDLNQFRQEIIADQTKITDIVRASPAIVNGQFIGFRVRAGRKRKVFRQLNFRPNDIITEINGIVLDSQSKGLQVLGQLQEATSLSIKVKRGDQEVYIDHSF